ncbi:MAG TPA: O-antigen ligase family protein [Verrucomicrobiota bacterium]|nr:O-antigen ligase family protein [Verrucomicrobiota bacterium]HNT15545.1 O-antigen ligase family protein [Verrucomicrobiota bacterium]
MSRHRTSTAPPPSLVQRRATWFAPVLGTFLGIGLLKFGTPTVMDHFLDLPANAVEWLVFAWPLRVAHLLMSGVALVGLLAWRKSGFQPCWFIFLPLGWGLWQALSTIQSVEPALSLGVLAHFLVCLVCFYLGLFSLHPRPGEIGLWLPLTTAFGIMLAVGFDQHFGGLQETREYFWTELYPKLTNVPPEYLQKMQSNRIFSTVFYPNAFAGALLLLTPPVLTWIWQAKIRFTRGARVFLCGAAGIGSATCLYWTGSKGGWLLALLAGWAALLHQNLPRQLKLGLIALLLLGGGTGFYLKNREYMRRGATSVVARFDYWRAAWQTARARPLFGTGPATFAIAYQKVKSPESEMARLAHNDYLQQASDSGFPGLLSYLAFIGGTLALSYRRLNWHKTPLAAAVWLGLFAWALQSTFEFSLYVPSLAWIAFSLMGWLLRFTGETNGQNTHPKSNLLSQ